MSEPVASCAVPSGLDRAGVIMSTACAIHCALMPAVAGILPLIGFGFLAGEATEIMLLLAATAIALISLSGGCRHHGRFTPLALVGMGFALIMTGRIWMDARPAVEPIFVVSGALLVASAHLVNWRLCCAARDQSMRSG